MRCRGYGDETYHADREILERYGAAIDPYYCRLCAQCESTCPRGVAISVINRSIMYAEGYGDIELAKKTYRGIPSRASIPHVSIVTPVSRAVRTASMSRIKWKKALRLFA
jgi:ferredoxin